MSAPTGFSAKQVASIAEADGKLNIWEGSVRSGKTVGSLFRWLAHIDEQRDELGEVFCFGRTRETLARNVFGPLSSPGLTGPIAKTVRYTSGAPTAQVLGQTVHVIGVNDRTAEEKARGLTGKSAYGDELTVIGEEFFTQAVARLSIRNSKLFGTTNPGSPAHWLRQKFLLRADVPELRLRSWHFKLDDNPFIPEAEKAAIKASHTGVFYRKFIEGQWVAAEGAVFDVFDEDRHVVDEVPPIARRLSIGVDYGTTAPFAALSLALLQDGRLCLTRELRSEVNQEGRKFTDSDHLRRLEDWVGGERVQFVAVDPSAASFKEEMRRSRHPMLMRARDADNAVLDGIRLMSSLLAKDQLVVHRSCTGLINEMPGYSWDDRASEKGEDKPVKVDDHSIDAARYAIYTSRSLWQAGMEGKLSSPAGAARVPARSGAARPRGRVPMGVIPR